MDLTEAVAGIPMSWDVRNTQTAKFWKIMRLTAVFLLAASLHVAATGLSQKVTLNVKNAPLKTVFVELNKQTGYNFLYADETLAKASAVTLKVKDVALADVLALCFKDQPLGFTIENNSIVIKQKAPVISNERSEEKSPAALIDIKGRLVNENNEPVPGASIKVKGTTNGTTTNANGEFVLTGVDENATLIFTGTNIETFEKKIGSSGDLGTITAKIKIAALNEVIINKGYYTEKQKVSTSNTFTVKAKDIETQPVQNLLLALIGRVPGLQIEQQTGYANSGVVVRIQGINSLSSGLDPLYVIDGVPYISQPLPTTQSAGILGGSGNNNPNNIPAGSGNPLSFINPADIESIDILKDADATSIYGSRGANGVILITTKKGKAGRTRFTANMQTSWGKVGRKINLLNTEQYIAMRMEAKANDNAAILPSDYDINGTWDKTRYTDWQDVLLGGTARYTDVQLSISGGNSDTKFMLSGNHHRETTIFPGDFADKKNSLQFNVHHFSSNKKLELQFSGTYLTDNNKVPTLDLTTRAMQLAPNAPSLYNDDGSLNWAPVVSGGGTVSSWTNPLANLVNPYKNSITNLISQALVTYKLLPGLRIKSSFGYSAQQSDELYSILLDSYRPELRATGVRAAHYGNGKVNGWNIEPQAIYELELGNGRIESLFGITFQNSTTNRKEIQGQGYTSDLVVEDIRAAASYRIISSLFSEYNYNAVFGRINYNYADKYIVNITGRRDGSSRFGSRNIFQNFWGVGGAWIFSDEEIVKAKLPYLSFGKLKASYGTSGNDNIGDYFFLSLYSPLSVGVAYQGISSMEAARLPNPFLQWEETKKMNLGIELGFLSDRIQFSCNYYRNRSSNLITSQSLSRVAGFSTVNINFEGIVQNTGWEMGLNTVNIKSKKFTWLTNFNLTIPRNKLVSFPNLANTPSANIYVVGKSLYDGKSYLFQGVDPATGNFVFSDSKGNATTLPGSADLVGFRNTSSKLYGGIQNSISYNGFDLDFTFQFQKKNGLDYLFNSYAPGTFNGTGNTGNQPVSVLNRWQKPGDIAIVPRFTTLSNSLPVSVSAFNNMSNGVIRDASFLQLVNVSLSWQLRLGGRAADYIQAAKLFVRGQNLFTIANNIGLNPSTNSVTSLPPLRLITIGGSLTF